MYEQMLIGLDLILSFETILIMIGGVFVGVIFGSIPGLTSSIGIAVFIPLTFYLKPVPAIALLTSIYVGGAYGGSIPAIIFGTPGTPESSTTTFDGYPMTKKGLGPKALSTALYSSAGGNFISSCIMIVMAMGIAQFALKVGPAEYFAIILFSLILIATIGTSGSWAKGLASVFLGLLVSAIGSDPIIATPRFNFGFIELTSEIPLIPVLVGLFVGAQVIEQVGKKQEIVKFSTKGNKELNKFTRKDIKTILPSILRGSIIGSVLGALPALNACVAATLNYSITKKFSKHPEKFGTGCIEGVASSEAANNATVGPALVPMLTLGIPGTATASLFLAALMIQGITPGPTIFREDGYLVYGVFFCLIIATFILVLVGKFVIHIEKYVLLVPLKIIYPIIILMCCAGAFCANRRIFDIYILLIFILAGFLMSRVNVPVLPLIIGFLLGTVMERSFRQAMLISKGSFMIFLNSPIALTFLIITLAVLLYSIVIEPLLKKKNDKFLKNNPTGSR